MLAQYAFSLELKLEKAYGLSEIYIEWYIYLYKRDYIIDNSELKSLPTTSYSS